MLSLETFFQIILPGVALFVGSCVGSFLNVVIYRVPIGLSVNEPKRSFCPLCKYDIPWYQNLPLLSWLLLRGRCSSCKKSIPVRYFGVELLTAVVFFVIWMVFVPAYGPGFEMGVGVAMAYWILASLLICAIFIDIDHYIIPDSITLGGLVVGLIAVLIVPDLMGQTSRLQALWLSVVGAAAGYGLLWGVVQFGKLAFGKTKRSFDEPVDWSIGQEEDADEPMIKIADEVQPWTDVFFRSSDRMIVDVTELRINGESLQVDQLVVWHDRFVAGDRSFPLEEVKHVEGKCTQVVIPREAMGFGDVKFIAMIGAFLGWQAVLLTVFVASILGAVLGLTQKMLLRDSWAQPLPFGPYLAAGAFVWMFYGERIVAWYLGGIGF
ncbi:MAG: prepilin peptidase [Verrucomicrobiales bacterium]|nr:prepilin peptidase [Verrucomicrobiales bacterium]